jgi:hypothetical protein
MPHALRGQEVARASHPRCAAQVVRFSSRADRPAAQWNRYARPDEESWVALRALRGVQHKPLCASAHEAAKRRRCIPDPLSSAEVERKHLLTCVRIDQQFSTRAHTPDRSVPVCHQWRTRVPARAQVIPWRRVLGCAHILTTCSRNRHTAARALNLAESKQQRQVTVCARAMKVSNAFVRLWEITSG